MKTLQIAIIDDNLRDLNVIVSNLEDIVIKNFSGMKVQIEKYLCPLDYFSTAKNYDLILLDYELPNMNGTLVAERINKSNSTAKIIFVSGYKNL